jgi:hypothetical protein
LRNRGRRPRRDPTSSSRQGEVTRGEHRTQTSASRYAACWRNGSVALTRLIDSSLRTSLSRAVLSSPEYQKDLAPYADSSWRAGTRPRALWPSGVRKRAHSRRTPTRQGLADRLDREASAVLCDECAHFGRCGSSWPAKTPRHLEDLIGSAIEMGSAKDRGQGDQKVALSSSASSGSSTRKPTANRGAAERSKKPANAGFLTSWAILGSNQ